MNIYEELGVMACINANEWYSSQGGSMLKDVIIQKADHFGEDAAIAIPGARRVEIGGTERSERRNGWWRRG